MIFIVVLFAQSEKTDYLCAVLNDKAMFNTLKGLKAREEMLDNLRFLFRYEDQLKQEGWYSDSEFFEEVVNVFLEAVAKQFKE